jgi:cytochrome b561
MKTKNIFKLLLDFAMLIIYSLLLFGYSMGAVFHEVAGIGVGLFMILHLVLNVDWIKGLKKATEKGNTRAIVMGTLDIILVSMMFVTVITGILISTVVFPSLLTFGFDIILAIHNACSWITFGAMVLHFGLHLKYVAGAFKNMIANFSKPAVIRAYSLFAAVVVVASIIYAQFYALDGSAVSAIKAESSLYSSASSSSVSSIVTDSSSQTSSYASSSETSSAASASSASAASAADSSAQDEAAADTETSSQAADNETITESSTEEAAESSSEQIVSSAAESVAEPAVSLNEYLGGLNCTGCSRHCSLLSPRCGRGQAQATSATTQYYQEYGITE